MRTLRGDKPPGMQNLSGDRAPAGDLLFAIDQAAYTALTDASGRILEVNERFERTMGFTAQSLGGRTYRALLGEPLSLARLGHMREQLSTHHCWRGELKFKSRGGRAVWAECHVMRLPGQPALYRTIAFDITERKAVEDALGAHQRFSQALMESAPVGIFLSDAEGRCRYVNRRWSEVSGRRLRAAVVPGWELAVHPDDRMAVSEAWASFVRGEREFQEEFRYRHEDGKESYVRAAAVRLDGEGGNPPSFLRVEQDLTELRRSQRLVDEQRLKMVAASKLTALGEMAGGVAHEINNPLAIIHGNAEVLRLWAEQGELDRERVCTMAQTLSITTTRIAKIVRGLRTISRNAEHDPCEQAPLAPLLEHVVSLSAARARDEQIEIEVSPVPPDFTVPCRPAQVSQVLLNLLNNAFYACREGERWVRLEVKDGGSEVEIAVLDGGRGVPPSVREKLFQPFFTTKPVGSGTGLGLSIGAALAESHGGSLALDPASPRTRFVLKLPKHAYRKAS